MDPCPPDSRAQIVERLTAEVRRIERGALPGGTAGCRAVPRARLIACCPRDASCQARSSSGWPPVPPAAPARSPSRVRQAAAGEQGGQVVVVDRQGEFYPPAARGLGLSLTELIVVRPRSERDERWVVDQSLRCRGVAALVAWPERLDGRTFRRWQLAAEAGGCLGLLLRPERARREPSWAEARLWVEPRPSVGWGEALRAPPLAWPLDPGSVGLAPHPTGRRVGVEVLHARGGATGRSVELEIDDATHAVRVAPPLAAATVPRRSAGA
ncbi:MAG: hypothetical protein U0836_28270 [Pirellulales bacterium]